jgi:hypothetical protein
MPVALIPPPLLLSQRASVLTTGIFLPLRSLVVNFTAADATVKNTVCERGPTSSRGPGRQCESCAGLKPVSPGAARYLTDDTCSAGRRTRVTMSLEKYVLGKALGSGAFATCRIGENKDTGEKVAVKSLLR